MRGELPEIELTDEQEDEAARIEDVLNARGRAVNRYMARLLASKSNREFFGETEFQIRDAVHRLGAAGIDTALAERNCVSFLAAAKRRGIKVRAWSVRTPPAGRTPSFTDTGIAE